MTERLERLLAGDYGSHVLPFVWMKGEDPLTIREEIDRIEACGIREICLESRPHPDFCGPGWWETLDFVLEEARRREMKVWVLDDDKFPTGHCNGALAGDPGKQKVYLAERHMDIMGPCRSGAVLVENFLQPDGKLLGILACPKPDGETLAVSGDGILDLTGRMENGFVYFDLPEGAYRLFVLFTTQKGGGRADYMNLVDRESVRVLIDEVYEKHYQRYAKYFGSTLAGFFSDEPELGNVNGYPFDDTLGKKDQRLPWSRELEAALREAWGEEFLLSLPALWYACGRRTQSVRFTYMDRLTRLVYSCFSGQIGKWCRDRGVEYIGHIIEDDNAHARMGCSIGHYFREMSGRQMAGVDVVHHQIVPGFTEPVHQWIAGDRDGEFFHYGLAKLGSSAAHIDPSKKSRALCEIFGNYGWAEGNSLMKWLTNHMLVRGINEFTPHAFSMKYPDRDCPPHFYARGNNPGFGCFAQLMKYMNRAAHFLSGGTHLADAAVLYHAENEWGGGRYMYFQKPGRALMERQLDYDVIPADELERCRLSGDDALQNGRLLINGESYPCLVLPYAEYLSRAAAEFAVWAGGKGLPCLVVDGLPEGCADGGVLPEGFGKAVRVVGLEELADAVEQYADRELAPDQVCPNLRLLLRSGERALTAMFFNESVSQTVETRVMIKNPAFSSVSVYDPWHNTACSRQVGEQGIPLCLLPGEALFLEFSEAREALPWPCSVRRSRLETRWLVSRRGVWEDAFAGKLVLEADGEGALPNLNGPGYYPDFTGAYRYRGQFTFSKREGAAYRLLLPEASDCVRVELNGEDLGYLAGFPARLDLGDAVKDGENELVLDVSTTLVWKCRDGASTHLQIPATGITKCPVLEELTRP